MKIIAIGHRKNVGKDTAANFIVTDYRLNHPGCQVIKTGFASKIKQIAYELYAWAGMQDENYYELNRSEREIKLPHIHKTPRQIWIEIGNKIREIYDPTWLKYPLSRKVDLIVFKDLRYLTEANAILELGGLLIKINNPGVVDTDDEADIALNDYNKWHHTINNCVNLREFHALVLGITKEYLYGK